MGVLVDPPSVYSGKVPIPTLAASLLLEPMIAPVLVTRVDEPFTVKLEL